MKADPTELLDALFIEAKRVLQDMARTQDLDMRRVQSETLKNLCDAIDVFFCAMSEAMSVSSMLDFDDDDDIFDDDNDDDDDDGDDDSN